MSRTLSQALWGDGSNRMNCSSPSIMHVSARCPKFYKVGCQPVPNSEPYSIGEVLIQSGEVHLWGEVSGKRCIVVVVVVFPPA